MVLIGPRKRCLGCCTVVGNTWLTHSRHCVLIRTQAPFHFFSRWTPEPMIGIPGAISKIPKLAPMGSPHR